ncbi:hypothetical protein CDL15_Pgr006352 [Punica granatum]|uniref:Uncharacterized protein n=1 Tax=Punica granatum TaxID=22663 RepID=A0A218WA75_PUNGR|nr:hypothetical protein CDL15_Pgr006352 [Punica granatum]
MQLKESKASGRIYELEKETERAETGKQSIELKLAKLNQERKNLSVEMNRMNPELLKLKDSINKRSSYIAELEKRINEIVDRIYKDSGPSAEQGAEVKAVTGQSAYEICKWKEDIREWKLKSDGCEQEAEEWKEKASNARTNISKLVRLTSSGLNGSLLQDKHKEKHDTEFKQKFDALVSEIERAARNLKALDRYESPRKKERAVSEEFDLARKDEKEVADKHNAVKQRRE